MKPKILFILLLISLAFNVGFIFCYLYKVSNQQNAQIPAPTQRSERPARTAVFFQNEEMKTARSENMELRKEFFSELAQPELEIEKISELMLKLELSQTALEKAVLEHFLSVRQEMNAEEAEVFFSRFLNRYENRHQSRQEKSNQKGRNRR
ncbi:MAG: hypothetical protein FWG98_01950 [Candidatus Cloacimonetes bacterium]|nr:hypothetical protein [Candidatus Cloacimonadota bacterium]